MLFLGTISILILTNATVCFHPLKILTASIKLTPSSYESNLAVFQGWSWILLGVGPLDNEGVGKRVRLDAGDVIVLPAGVSHCSQTYSEYRYIGAYPKVPLEHQILVHCVTNLHIRDLQNGRTNTDVIWRSWQIHGGAKYLKYRFQIGTQSEDLGFLMTYGNSSLRKRGLQYLLSRRQHNNVIPALGSIYFMSKLNLESCYSHQTFQSLD